MISRLGLVLLFLTGLAAAVAYTTGVGYSIPIEKAVKAEVSAMASPAKINEKILSALERDDIEEADMYAEVARFLNYQLPASTLSKLKDAHELSATVVRNTVDFGEGFVTGKGESNAGIAGAVTSDLTVIGDLRDIAIEGTKWLRDEEYSEIILGLSVIGVGVTAATIATGGGGVIVKAGLSLLKTARKAGRLTNEFASVLTRLTTDAVNFPLLRQTLRNTDLSDLAQTQRVFSAYGRNVRGAKLLPLLSKMGEVNSAVGPAETVKLMRFIKSANHLDDVSAMTKKFGIRSRAIIELTGKTSLRAFKTSFTLVEWFASSIFAVIVWVGGLILMSLARGVRLFRRRTVRA